MATTALQQTNNHQSDRINLTWPERYISIAAGVKLATSALRHLFKSPFTSILKLGAGGFPFKPGVTGGRERFFQIGETTTHPGKIKKTTTFTNYKPPRKGLNLFGKTDK